MAGKRDDIFVLGEEQLGAEAPSAPIEELTASAPLPGRSRAPRPRLGWPLVFGGLVLIAAIALVALPGDDGDPVQPRVAAPAPATGPVVRTPVRPQTAPERELRRPRSRERRSAAPPAVERPAPVAEPPAAPIVTYEPAPEPAPEVTSTPPEPATPAAPPRPEFGIER